MSAGSGEGQAHAGTVQPRDGGGFTWECICGARPDPVTSWGSFDGAALALQRHIDRNRGSQTTGLPGSASPRPVLAPPTLASSPLAGSAEPTTGGAS